MIIIGHGYGNGEQGYSDVSAEVLTVFNHGIYIIMSSPVRALRHVVFPVHPSVCSPSLCPSENHVRSRT